LLQSYCLPKTKERGENDVLKPVWVLLDLELAYIELMVDAYGCS